VLAKRSVVEVMSQASGLFAERRNRTGPWSGSLINAPFTD
jgi:hypothetical protein